MTRPDLSIALVCWQMSREVPRTLWSLSRAFQQGIGDLDYEIIVVDNGSDQVPQAPRMDPVPRILTVSEPSVSPVAAMNQALSMARGRVTGAWIDGARMASGGLLRAVHNASRLHEHPVIAVPNWQLGPNRQAVSVHDGYCAQVEDDLLTKAGWPSPATDFFSIASPEMKDVAGPMLESNALFLRTGDWRALGGFDPAFTETGGGAANPDMFFRALELPGTQQIRIAGEATFHQIHGGTTTDGQDKAVYALKELARSYQRLRGHPLRMVRDRGWIYDATTGMIDTGL
ncbi:glycosyltransferase family 2 protein [Falsiphaeobacter marinintestinus]|uniref:glycosyltransferase family 2 protein n=1 Tax=Falsiphaeobacter marinintestinus TaxID=1492905 RepID=UPI0011B6CE06|nr:glycosyltransferase family A protein [Phaeobacter marinintestinus]